MISDTETSYLKISSRKILKGVSIGFIGSIIGMGFGYLSRMVIARYLEPSAYGLISLAIAGLTITTTIGLFGLPQGIVRYISFYQGKEDINRIKGTIISALKISFFISLVFGCLLFVLSGWLSLNLFNEPDLTWLLQMFSIAVPFSALATVFIQATMGFQEMKYRFYVTDSFQNIFRLVGIIILLNMGYGIYGVAFAWVISIVLTSFLAAYCLERKVFSIFNAKIKSVPLEKELFLFSWPLMFAGILYMILSWTDTFMIEYFRDSFEVGIYNAAQPTVALMSITPMVFTNIFLPVISELYAKNKRQEMDSTYKTVTKWVFFINCPIFFLVILFPSQILNLLFGSIYIVGASALTILSFGYLAISLSNVSAGVLSTLGKTKIILFTTATAAIVNFLLNYMLIPIYGIDGAALSSAISLIIGAILGIYATYFFAKSQPFDINYLKLLLSASIAFSLIYFASSFFLINSVYTLLAMSILYFVIYFFLLLFFRSFDSEDIMMIQEIEGRFGMRFKNITKIIEKFL